MIQLAIKSIPNIVISLVVFIVMHFIFMSIDMIDSPFYPVLLGGVAWMVGFFITKNYTFSTIGVIMAAIMFVSFTSIGVV